LFESQAFTNIYKYRLAAKDSDHKNSKSYVTISMK